MDSRLRSQLRKFIADPVPENAMSFANAYIRSSEPPPPILKEPLTIEQLFDSILAQPDREELNLVDEVNHYIELNVNISLDFDEMFPAGQLLNPFEYFLELIESKAISDGTIEDLAYDLFEVNPETDVLYINVRGWVELWVDHLFTKTYAACHFCDNRDLSYSSLPGGAGPAEGIRRVECENCGWYWREPSIIAQRVRRKNPDERLRELERRYSMEGGVDLRSKVNSNRIRMNLPPIPPEIVIFGLRNPQHGFERHSLSDDIAIQSPVTDEIILSSVIRKHHNWYGLHHALLNKNNEEIKELAEHRVEKYPTPSVRQLLAAHLHIFYLLETGQEIKNSDIENQHPCLPFLNVYSLYEREHFFWDAVQELHIPVSMLLNCRVCGTTTRSTCEICRMLVCNNHLDTTICGRQVCSDDDICGGFCAFCNHFVCARDGYLHSETGNWYCRTSPPCYADSPFILEPQGAT